MDNRLPEENIYVIAAIKGVYGEQNDVQVLRHVKEELPWFVDFANFLCARATPPNFTRYTKKKFLRDVRYFYRDEPYLYKRCADGLYQRCIAETEVAIVIFYCH